MEVFYTPEAQADLMMVRYTLDMWWENPQLTEKILRKITEAIRALCMFPNKGTELSGIVGIPTEYRHLYCEHNNIFYRVEKDAVRIIRILNEKEDFMRVLFGIMPAGDGEPAE